MASEISFFRLTTVRKWKNRSPSPELPRTYWPMRLLYTVDCVAVVVVQDFGEERVMYDEVEVKDEVSADYTK